MGPASPAQLLHSQMLCRYNVQSCTRGRGGDDWGGGTSHCVLRKANPISLFCTFFFLSSCFGIFCTSEQEQTLSLCFSTGQDPQLSGPMLSFCVVYICTSLYGYWWILVKKPHIYYCLSIVAQSEFKLLKSFFVWSEGHVLFCRLPVTQVHSTNRHIV